MDDRNDETNDERFALVRRKSGQTLEKSREESDETRNVRCAINASLPMFVANVDEREKVGAVEPTAVDSIASGFDRWFPERQRPKVWAKVCG